MLGLTMYNTEQHTENVRSGDGLLLVRGIRLGIREDSHWRSVTARRIWRYPVMV